MLKWFTTIPGLLVLCGIVLLIIAVVLFILGNKREKSLNAVARPSTDSFNNQPLGSSTVATVDPMAPTNTDSGLIVDGGNEETSTYDFSVPAESPIGEQPTTVTYDFSVPGEGSGLEEKESEFNFELPTVDAAPVVEEPTVESQPEVTVYGVNNTEEAVVTPVSNEGIDIPKMVTPEVSTVDINTPIPTPVNDFGTGVITTAPIIEDQLVEDKTVAEEEAEAAIAAEPVSEVTVEPAVEVTPVADEIAPVVEEPTVVENPVNDFVTAPVIEEPAPVAVEATPVVEEPTVVENPANDFGSAIGLEPIASEPAVEAAPIDADSLVEPQASEISTIELPSMQADTNISE